MINNKRPTIKDIAKIAGVSHVTVSQSLRDMPCISEPTRIRIKEIAKEIGYTPNLAARNLSLRNPSSIGMIVPSLGTETVYNEIVNTLSELAANDNLCLLLGSSNRSIEMEKSYCKMMCENMVGALIIAPCTSDVSHIHEICDDLVPVIYLGGKVSNNEKNYIKPDFYKSGQMAVHYLHQLGHQDIALFLYSPDNATIQAKLKGYTDAMNSFNLTPTVYWNGESTDTYHAGYSLIIELLKKDSLPSAIWCASDLMAYGVLEALKENESLLSKKVSVLGHDDLFFSSLPSNSLSTIALPKVELAQSAYIHAKKLMEDKTLSCKILVNNHLIKRNSTKEY